MSKRSEDTFSNVANQITCKKHAISDTRSIKQLQDYILKCYGESALYLDFLPSGQIEAVLGTSGEIVQLPNIEEMH